MKFFYFLRYWDLRKNLDKLFSQSPSVIKRNNNQLNLCFAALLGTVCITAPCIRINLQ